MCFEAISMEIGKNLFFSVYKAIILDRSKGLSRKLFFLNDFETGQILRKYFDL